jgi:ankyrin repeat protein
MPMKAVFVAAALIALIGLGTGMGSLRAASPSGTATPPAKSAPSTPGAPAPAAAPSARGEAVDQLDRSLREAAAAGDAERVEALLKTGADPNALDADGITPLMVSVVGDIERVRGIAVKGIGESWHKGLPKIIKAMKGDPASAKALLKGGAAVNAATPRGITALDLAALGGNPALVTLLLDHGADANQRAKRGETALMVASVAGQNPIVKLLLGRGADPMLQSEDGITAVTAAMLAGNLEGVQILTKAIKPKDATF